jgi:hypothetical protein
VSSFARCNNDQHDYDDDHDDHEWGRAACFPSFRTRTPQRVAKSDGCELLARGQSVCRLLTVTVAYRGKRPNASAGLTRDLRPRAWYIEDDQETHPLLSAPGYSPSSSPCATKT